MASPSQAASSTLLKPLLLWVLVLGFGGCGGSGLAPGEGGVDASVDVAVDVDSDRLGDLPGDGDVAGQEVLDALGDGTTDTPDAAPDSDVTADAEVTGDADVDAGDSVITPVEPTDLFVLGPPVSVDLLIDDAGLESLQVAPRQWVAGTVKVAGWPQADGQGAVPTGLQVQVRLGGEFGGERELTEKAYFVLRFAAPFAGLEYVELNNNVRNRAQARAQVSYAMARSWGVPAPRATWAWVTLNGAVYGLYGLEEAYQDPAFVQVWWPAMAADGFDVYRAGSTFGDVASGVKSGLQKVTGDPEDRAALEALIDALEVIDQTVPDEGLMEALGAHFKMDAYIDFAALEIFIAHTEGVAIGRRNHVLVHDHATQRWHYAVAGADRAFRLLSTPWVGSGRVHRLCLRSPQCRLQLGERLASVVTHAASNGIVGVAQSACAMVTEQVLLDPMLEATPAQVAGSCNQMIGRLLAWAEALPYNLACADPPAVDHDGDGYSGCTDDCNDEDPAINPGAPEACNLVDDDCSGAIDDVDTCNKCVSFTSTLGVDYDLCFEPKNWEDARDFCVERGGEMASIHDAATQLEVKDAAFNVLFTNWWIGLSDSEAEGQWSWSDGTPLNYTRWNDGEPNDSNGEDCGHLSVWGDGNWNDVNCTNTYAVICQLPL